MRCILETVYSPVHERSQHSYNLLKLLREVGSQDLFILKSESSQGQCYNQYGRTYVRDTASDRHFKRSMSLFLLSVFHRFHTLLHLRMAFAYTFWSCFQFILVSKHTLTLPLRVRSRLTKICNKIWMRYYFTQTVRRVKNVVPVKKQDVAAVEPE